MRAFFLLCRTENETLIFAWRKAAFYMTRSSVLTHKRLSFAQGEHSNSPTITQHTEEQRITHNTHFPAQSTCSVLLAEHPYTQQTGKTHGFSSLSPPF